MMSNYKMYLLLFCSLALMSAVHTEIRPGDQINVIAPKEEKETFIAAVYEHKPIPALPVCFEKGIWFDISYSNALSAMINRNLCCSSSYQLLFYSQSVTG